MESRLLLDIVIQKSVAVLELFDGEDEAQPIWQDTLLVLNLGVVDGVRGFHLEGDGEGLDEDLQVKDGIFPCAGPGLSLD